MENKKEFCAGCGAELSEEALGAAAGGNGNDELLKIAASKICDDMERQARLLICDEAVRSLLFGMIHDCRAMIAACNWYAVSEQCNGLDELITMYLYGQEACSRLMSDVRDLRLQIQCR